MSSSFVRAFEESRDSGLISKLSRRETNPRDFQDSRPRGKESYSKRLRLRVLDVLRRARRRKGNVCGAMVAPTLDFARPMPKIRESRRNKRARRGRLGRRGTRRHSEFVRKQPRYGAAGKVGRMKIARTFKSASPCDLTSMGHFSFLLPSPLFSFSVDFLRAFFFSVAAPSLLLFREPPLAREFLPFCEGGRRKGEGATRDI